MTPEEMRDTVKESRELAEVFRTIADTLMFLRPRANIIYDI